MAADVSKHLDRAKRFLEKNRVEDAIGAYLAVLDEMPQHQEATQALGDLYARLDQPDRAAIYYGLLFDLLVEPKDETKALAIYNRFLRAGRGQPPERIARYAFLQQRQNHPDEAIEQYSKAAELFAAANRDEDALFCWERLAQLDPENLPRQIFRIELRKPLPAEQRVFVAVGRREQLRRLAVLLDCFVRMILSLLQEGVPSDAFRRLPTARSQKPVVNGERLGFVLGFHEQVKKKPVVDCRPVRLIQPRVQVAQRLRGFLMLRHLVQHGEIRPDRFLDTVLLEEALGAIQMFAYVCGHPLRLPLR